MFLTNQRHLCQYEVMTEYVHVKPDLRLPRAISGTSEFQELGYDVAFEASWVEDRYEIDTVKVIRKKGADPIDGGVLRSVRVAQAFEALMHNAKGIQLEDGTPYKFPYDFDLSFEGDKPEILITSTMTVPISVEEGDKVRLLEAARLHTIATAYGVRSLFLVASVLGVQHRTASRLILKARQQGLLDEK